MDWKKAKVGKLHGDNNYCGITDGLSFEGANVPMAI